MSDRVLYELAGELAAQIEYQLAYPRGGEFHGRIAQLAVLGGLSRTLRNLLCRLEIAPPAEMVVLLAQVDAQIAAFDGPLPLPLVH